MTKTYYVGTFGRSDDLEHYGRLGMKWGQHIFGTTPSQYYEKGAKRLAKYDKKAQNYRDKSEKLKSKYYEQQINSQSSLLFRKSRLKKATRTAKKAYTQENKALRQENKALKLSNKMKTLFSGTKLSGIDPTLLSIGEKYSKMTISDINAHSKSATQFLKDSLINYGTIQAYNKFQASTKAPDPYDSRKNYN